MSHHEVEAKARKTRLNSLAHFGAASASLRNATVMQTSEESMEMSVLNADAPIEFSMVEEAMESTDSYIANATLRPFDAAVESVYWTSLHGAWSCLAFLKRKFMTTFLPSKLLMNANTTNSLQKRDAVAVVIQILFYVAALAMFIRLLETMVNGYLKPQVSIGYEQESEGFELPMIAMCGEVLNFGSFEASIGSSEAEVNRLNHIGVFNLLSPQSDQGFPSFPEPLHKLSHNNLVESKFAACIQTDSVSSSSSKTGLQNDQQTRSQQKKFYQQALLGSIRPFIPYLVIDDSYLQKPSCVVCFDHRSKLKQDQIWSLRMDTHIPINCNTSTAVKEFGTNHNCLQNFMISLGISLASFQTLQAQATSINIGVVNCTNVVLCPEPQFYPYECCWRNANDSNTVFVLQNSGNMPQSSSMKSSIDKAIYDVQSDTQFPTLRGFRKQFESSLNTEMYVPSQAETEIFLKPVPTSSTVGVCNSLLPSYQRVIQNVADATPCLKKNCKTNCLNASCFLSDWNPAEDIPPLYADEFKSWQLTPNVSSFRLCNAIYVAPPSDFFFVTYNYSPKNGDLLTLFGNFGGAISLLFVIKNLIVGTSISLVNPGLLDSFFRHALLERISPLLPQIVRQWLANKKIKKDGFGLYHVDRRVESRI